MKLKNILNESNRDAFNRSLTREQKREIMDSVSRFNDFGSKIYKTNRFGSFRDEMYSGVITEIMLR